MTFALLDWIKHPSHLPLVGSIFGTTPEQDALKKQIANLQGVYASYRPQIAGAQMQGLQNQLNAFAPVNSLIGEIQGKGMNNAGQQNPFFNLNGTLGQNPMASMFAPPVAPAAPTSPVTPPGQPMSTPMLGHGPNPVAPPNTGGPPASSLPGPYASLYGSGGTIGK